MTEPKILNIGEILTFTEGEYSDRDVGGVVRVIKAFDLKQVLSEWEERHTRIIKVKNSQFTYRALKNDGLVFMSYLIDQALAESPSYIILHTDQHGFYCGTTNI